MTSLPIAKGTGIFIAIYSSNRNKAIWGEDATEWKPERWLGDGVPKAVVEARIPGVYSNLYVPRLLYFAKYLKPFIG